MIGTCKKASLLLAIFYGIGLFNLLSVELETKHIYLVQVCRKQCCGGDTSAILGGATLFKFENEEN